MPKGKKYPKACTDLERMFDHLDKEEKQRKRAEFLQSRKEDKPSAEKE